MALALPPAYRGFRFHPDSQKFHQDALTETVTTPAEPLREWLDSYGFPSDCRQHYALVRQAAEPYLKHWASEHGVEYTDPEMRWSRPEAFRLREGGSLWPTQNCTVLLLPLNNHTVKMSLRKQGSGNEEPLLWPPDIIIQLTETGLKFEGRGSIKFIYVMLRCESV